MSMRRATVDALLDALSDAGTLSVRSMFGEFAVYLEGRVVAFVCDDQMFVKPVAGARAALPDADLAPPYPGAKDHILAADALDEPEPVVAALRAAAREVPLPKPRKGKAI